MYSNGTYNPKDLCMFLATQQRSQHGKEKSQKVGERGPKLKCYAVSAEETFMREFPRSWVAVTITKRHHGNICPNHKRQYDNTFHSSLHRLTLCGDGVEHCALGSALYQK